LKLKRGSLRWGFGGHGKVGRPLIFQLLDRHKLQLIKCY
jgi:hypothetical protein